MKKRSNRKLLFMLSTSVLVFCLLYINIILISVYKIHYRSGTNIDDYTKTISTKTEVIKSTRGRIYDANNNIIAYDIERYKIIANIDKERFGVGGEPAHVADINYTAEVLSPILSMSKDELVAYLSQENVKQVEFGMKGNNLSLTTKQAIEELKLPGIEFLSTNSRYYPEGAFSSQIIGLATYDHNLNRLNGVVGIESVYNDVLTGVDGKKTFQASSNGVVLPGTTAEVVDKVDGQDIYLTLDNYVQKLLDEALSNFAKNEGVEKVWGAVMEIETGRILGMTSYPYYDANNLTGELHSNLNTQFHFEPGSTMKMFTYAAAIDAGVYSGTSTFDSTIFKMNVKNGKPIRVFNNEYIETIQNAYNNSWGEITYNEGFSRSSNVAIAELLTNYLDTEVFYSYLENFGFMEKTEFDGFTEAAGSIQYNWPIEKLNVGFGQGINVTILQMLQASSALLNDGKMIKPYIVQQIKDPNTGKVTYFHENSVIGNPVSAETAAQMVDLMSAVINDENGTGRGYRQDAFTLIGKTGTAQVYKDGSYNSNYLIPSALLAFPKEDPKIVFYYAYEMEGTRISSKNYYIINELLYEIAYNYGLIEQSSNPNNETNNEFQINEMPSLINNTVEYSMNKLSDKGLRIVKIGNGNQIIDQYPEANEKVISNQIVFLKTNDSEVLMPNMIGWSRKEVTTFWSLTGISFTMDGFGTVVSQDVKEGTIIYPSMTINVKLE